jgi:rfaE bifunctional protein nucleotidyltransferase chain/domain
MGRPRVALRIARRSEQCKLRASAGHPESHCSAKDATAGGHAHRMLKLTFRMLAGPLRQKRMGQSFRETMAVDRILTLKQAYEVVEDLKRHGKRLVFTNGCFDLLHPGHTRYLAEARKLGDALIVALNSDRSVRALKGPGRPVQPEGDRAEILAALEVVDYVTIFDDETPQHVIARMLPQVLVKGGDWGPDEIVGRAEVEAAGGRVVSIPMIPGYSTSSIIQAVLKTAASEE